MHPSIARIQQCNPDGASQQQGLVECGWLLTSRCTFCACPHAQDMAPQLQLAVSEAAAGSSNTNRRQMAANELEAMHAEVLCCA